MCLLGLTSQVWGLPSEVVQEGLLLRPDGTPLDGLRNIRVKLYANAQGGAVLYQELHPNVLITQGYYAVAIGSEEPLPDELFSRPRLYLGITVNNGDELVPRTPLRKVPAAFYADVAEDVVGHIHPTQVTVTGQVVIDQEGQWVGSPLGLRGPAGPPGEAGPPGPPGPPGAGSPDTPEQVLGKIVQVDGPTSTLNADVLDGFHAADFPRTAAQVRDRLRQVDGPGSDINADTLDNFDSTDFVRTPEQLLTKLITVDGDGSTLDADRLDGLDSSDLILTADELLVLLKTVDGQGSGVDADRIDGFDSSQLILDAEAILENIKAVDGNGSGLDADRLDGLDSSAFILDGPQALALIKGVDGSGSGLDSDRLDGIDSSGFLRIEDQTLPDQILDALKTVDGTGSGLDADKLDGLQSNKFMRTDQATGTSGKLTASGGLVIPDGKKFSVGVNNPQGEVHVDGTVIATTVKADVVQTDTLHLNPLDEAPSPAAAGMVYFDSTAKGIKVFSGQKWMVLGEKIATSCKQLLEIAPGTVSGNYSIDFDGASGPMPSHEVFCDMDADGGGWTRITPCMALNLFGGVMVAEDGASTADIDGNCRPFTLDGTGNHTYHFTFTIPGGYREFFLDNYKIKSKTNGTHTSDLSVNFKQTKWSIAFKAGGSGDVSFGTSGQNGPIASYTKFLPQSQNCNGCTINFPKNGEIFDLGDTFNTFRIGWGEAGPQSEGWYPWWSGFIMIR